MSYTRHRNFTAPRACATALLATGLLAGGLVTASAQEKSLEERDKLTGTWGGARTALEDKGIEIGVVYIGEVLGISGGVKPTGGTYATYEGRLDVTINTDLEKLVGWAGAKTHVRAFQIHSAQGQNAANYVGSIADPSNIDAYGTTRLFTAWFQQEFGTWGSIRLGQLAGDDEFLVSTTAGGLINGTFGWAAIMAANLPSGGPAYPLATPGVRLQVNPTENISLLGAVFAGNPAGNCTSDNPQRDCNRYGTTFSLDGGAFWLGEAQYNFNQAKDATGLAGSYKLGTWYHTGDRFLDQYYQTDRSTDWGMYGVVDQMLWRGKEASTSIFVRGGWTPSDRNLVSWYIDGGVGFKGFVPGREADTLTVGVAHSKISREAVAYSFDNSSLQRSGETVLEVSYIAQINPWWTLQPDFQYISKPFGGVTRDDGSFVDDAYVFGVRTTITF
ncbi:porin [Rhodopseudomonas rhenobacensis]|uniref:Porin n=1 Tax=Rhodopseudomonas rhenobacensis TaxID=87461 RepID=A0A7W7Z5C4_9BRAD|nr:carbohydrate porin [Rhodopseudomonas rhenobacensis]MBB5048308.1 porin [Rhodopseudomonas rhenobacensis]